MKRFYVVGILSAIIVLSSFTGLEVKKYQIKTVVIDAGHGGKDPGCHGKASHESDVTLKVALELGRIIKENCPEVKVVYTRTTDKFVELYDRAAIANKQNADLFISIHCNSGPKTASGTETFTMGLHTSDENLEVAKRENSVILKEDNYQQKYDGYDPNSPMAHILMANYQKAFMENSISFAGKIEKQFKTKLKKNSRGVKQAGLLVLWKTYMPSVLVEIGFLTNSTEEKYMSNKTNRVYIASCVYRAFKEYKKEVETEN
ncbi:MAG TPA: N-acetylmuramoyl-L-alanine amidase [Cytophagaceae bacterium]|jgi:N-acetylmuramoyl-L-alanine amidase|nr:N-acetylmuramoyl-L-alanine amidase [Cytophagaceae bacterium]